MIRASDTVAAVLRRDPALLEVFAGLAPAFERLRTPGVGRVMSRLLTVGQAARMAGFDGDELAGRLNAALEAREPTRMEEVEMTGRTTEPAPAAGMPAALQGLAADRIVHADVREDLRAGREPFSRIMAALQQVPAGGALVVRAIFEPVPLYAVLGRQGFEHYTERLEADDWRVWFYPAAAAPGEVGVSGAGDAAPGEDPKVVVLDVRNLEPPEPMVQTLEALEHLPPDGTLVQLNVRVPQFLLPRLEERGFTYEIREQGPDLVRVFIRRAAAGRAGPHTNSEGF